MGEENIKSGVNFNAMGLPLIAAMMNALLHFFGVGSVQLWPLTTLLLVPTFYVTTTV